MDHRLGSTSFASFIYTYNAVNNRTSMASTQPGLTAQTDNYNYDAVDQIAGVAYGSGRAVNYSYDPVGNRQSVIDSIAGTTSYVANPLNQYTAVTDTSGTRNPTHDANGNLTAQGARSYAYDAQSRLTSAASVTQRLDTIYDARNRLIWRVAYTRASSSDPWLPSELYALFYDNWSLVTEYASDGTLRARYIHGSFIDELLAKTDTSGTVYYHHDALGSTRALTNSFGATIENYTYDAFGKAGIYDSSGSALTTTACGNRYLFTGREWLAGIQLYDYRNRMYS